MDANTAIALATLVVGIATLVVGIATLVVTTIATIHQIKQKQ